jgi:hypothetical protein
VAGTIVALVIVVFEIGRDTRAEQGVVAKAWLELRMVVASSDPASASPVDLKREDEFNRSLYLLIGIPP